MPIKREAPQFAGFFKITEHGQGIVGKLDVVRDIGKGGEDVQLIAVMSPAVVFVKEKKKIVSYQWKAVTINLSGDLRRKIDTGGKDQGQFFQIVYKDDEPQAKGSPMKIFEVDQLSRKEMAEHWNGADTTHANEPYPQEERKTAPAKSGINGGASDEGRTAEDEDDDLPF